MKELERMFDESIGRLSSSAEIDQNSLGLMLKGSELLKANTVSQVELSSFSKIFMYDIRFIVQIMQKHGTSWPLLWKKATETVRSRQSSSAPEIAEPSPVLVKVYQDAMGRKPGDRGFVPPPPPPRSRPAQSAAQSSSDSIAASAKPQDVSSPLPKRSFLEELSKFRSGDLKPVDTPTDSGAKPPTAMEAVFARQVDKSLEAILSLRNYIDPGDFDGSDSNDDTEFD
jgi:hypothetical protein